MTDLKPLLSDQGRIVLDVFNEYAIRAVTLAVEDVGGMIDSSYEQELIREAAAQAVVEFGACLDEMFDGSDHDNTGFTPADTAKRIVLEAVAPDASEVWG